MPPAGRSIFFGAFLPLIFLFLFSLSLNIVQMEKNKSAGIRLCTLYYTTKVLVLSNTTLFVLLFCGCFFSPSEY